MDALLNRLKSADPEVHHDISASVLGNGDYRNDYIIQGRLQDAIQARGWIYTIKNYAKPFAMIDRLDASDLIDRYGDSPAEALLSCYLEAIG